MKTEVVVIRGSQVVEETILLEEIRRNWRKMMVQSIWRKEFTFQITERYESKFYEKTIIKQT